MTTLYTSIKGRRLGASGEVSTSQGALHPLTPTSSHGSPISAPNQAGLLRFYVGLLKQVMPCPAPVKMSKCLSKFFFVFFCQRYGQVRPKAPS